MCQIQIRLASEALYANDNRQTCPNNVRVPAVAMGLPNK